MGKIRKFSPRSERNPIPIGTRFGRLVTTSASEPTSEGNGYRYYACQCDCGATRSIRKDSLLNGDTTSCGCYAKEQASERSRTHGLSNNPLYDVWSGMHKRCYNPKRKDYKHYGGRGIVVDSSWHGEEGLIKFIEDMYETYQAGLELDRKDVNGPYSKDNCRWTDRRTQVINRRPIGTSFDTHYLTYNGETKCMSEWAEEVGIPASMLSDRITTLNWSIEDALTRKPKVRCSKLVIHEGEFTPNEVFVHLPNVHGTARKLGLSCHEYMQLLFKEVGVVKVYLCKEWVGVKLSDETEHTDIFKRKVPKLSEQFIDYLNKNNIELPSSHWELVNG